MNKIIQKILVANRGEISIRIMTSAKRLGIKTVAIFSDNDKNSLYKDLADEAYPLGNGSLQETYLNIDKIINIAKMSDCDALHPGYGFLSENPDFALACEKNDIVFIGPNSKVIQLMGNKIEARKIAKEIGIPITESLEGSPEELMQKEITIPYPLIIKAASGGGGKGMKIVRNSSELKENIESASREALSYFGDGTVYIEKYVEEPRHIEVQVLADNYGNCIHLFERECTIQRRHQKIVEEAPSPTLTDELRKQITASAVKIAKYIGYNNAGTIEFLVDKDLKYYFLEMNTRIQVEHPVTEIISGIDIVEEQISVAKGQELAFDQSDLFINGHSIECRIYAENPANNFLPSPGEIVFYQAPEMEGIRVDSSIDKATVIQSDFDPMIAKLVSWGETREDARLRIIKALDDYYIQGIDNNIAYLKGIQNHSKYIDNQISTSYCNIYTDELIGNIEKKTDALPIESLIAGYLLSEMSQKNDGSVWSNIGYWRDCGTIELKIRDIVYPIEIIEHKHDTISFKMENTLHKASIHKRSDNIIEYFVGEKYFRSAVSAVNSYQTIISHKGLTLLVERLNVLHSDVVYEASELHFEELGDTIASPMFGKLIKINVRVGDTVQKGDTVMVIEAMKMENNICSHKDAVIETIYAKEGLMIESGKVLITFCKSEEKQ